MAGAVDDVQAELRIFGVPVTNATKAEAIDLVEASLSRADSTVAKAIFIANAHTLNLAVSDGHYSQLLRRAFRVFGDGTGVRWAARLRGVEIRDNLVGTDLIPELFERTAGRGYRVFLLGGTQAVVDRAAQYCSRKFTGWTVVGAHHGYLDSANSAHAIEAVNASHADLLLVAMGNPLQEQWIDQYLDKLEVGVAVGVGGLFTHWSGDLNRAPLWLRKLGFEWLQILAQQPSKWRRYLLGNPLFLYRMVYFRKRDTSVVAKHGSDPCAGI